MALHGAGSSASEVCRSLRKDFSKTKQYHAKTAEKSLFKYDILTNTKQAVVYEVYENVFVELVKLNDDGGIAPRNRAILGFDVLFALRSLLPVIQQELCEGKTSSYLLDRGTDLYLSTSQLPDRTHNAFRSYGKSILMLTNIRHKYEKADGTMMDGGTGITLSMLEVDAFRKLLPELVAMCLKFRMKPTVYYEEKEYRVFYHNESEAFINLDMMIRFSAPGIGPKETQKALVHYMKEQVKQRDIREHDREVQEKIQKLRQEMLMRLVFLCFIHWDIEKQVTEMDLDPSSDDYRRKAREILQEIQQIDACSLFCKAAVKTQIPLYSNAELYHKIRDSPDSRAVIVSQLITPEMLTDEEQTLVNVINTLLLEESVCN